MASDKKTLLQAKAHLILPDESGLCLDAQPRCTWGFSGQDLVERYPDSHREKLSVIGALSLSPLANHVGAYAHVYSGADISQEAVVAFLRDLQRHLHGPLVLLWDRWSVHRGSLVQNYLVSRPNIHVEWLPPYAPDLNPAEWLWKLLKHDRLANRGCLDIDQLQALFEAEYRDVIRRQDLLRSCIEASELPLRLSG